MNIPLCKAVALAALFVPLMFATACSQSDQDANEPGGRSERKQPVMTEGIVYQRELTRVEAVASSRALRSIELRPSVTGEVMSVEFSPGQRVARGDVLLRLDDRDQRLAVELAQVELEDAERRLDRYRRSAGAGGVTESMLDDARSEVERARIALRRAEVDLAYRTIEAPFSGYVGFTNVDPGAWVSTADVITTLDDRDTLLVSFQLPETLFGRLSEGERIELRTWNDNALRLDGEVVDVDSRVNESRRTFTLRAHVDNPGDLLRPGMSFRIALNLEGNRYPLVPDISLQWGSEGAYVWTVEDGEAVRTYVNVVQRTDRGVLVDADLPEGLPIVTEGVHIVRAGMDVQVVNTALTRKELKAPPKVEAESGAES
ncbi:efflux RND transporter periplasmic adaptor subunit [Marinimicrobium alkaliphilum]|uniref:efflux RND transporter periplasmic adaptor subunit n=1 Tax=Marinimicrobium alkaliphilum TaxID=2202654 RepID=UPI0018E09B62|nr:efflux RND transporter periplasmic adaptor subunit [Marinimicrobium alkaliphilum]